jgi:hypothetical protein
MFRTGVAVNWIRVDEEPHVAPLVDEPQNGHLLDRIRLDAVRHAKYARTLAWNIEKRAALTPKRATRNELMRPPIKFVFNSSKQHAEWLQEYFVKGEDLFAFIQFLANVLNENDVSILNASIRYVKQDPKTKLSYAQNADRFAVVLFFNRGIYFG